MGMVLEPFWNKYDVHARKRGGDMGHHHRENIDEIAGEYKT